MFGIRYANCDMSNSISYKIPKVKDLFDISKKFLEVLLILQIGKEFQFYNEGLGKGSVYPYSNIHSYGNSYSYKLISINFAEN